MSEHPGDADRRVVKKVVKKTVLRPVAPTVPRKAGAPVAKTGDESSATPASPASPTSPRQRTTRLTTPARAQASRAAATVAPTAPEPVTEVVSAGSTTTEAPEPIVARATPAAEPATEPAEAPKTKTIIVRKPKAAPVEPVETTQPRTKQPKVKQPKVKRSKVKTPKVKAPKVKKPRRRPSMPSMSLPALPKPDVRGRAASLGHVISHAIRAFFRAIGHRIAAAWHWLIGLRLPHLSPVRGSAITGLVVGLLAVTMGWGFYQLFSATLGTQAGGGWGFLAFVFLSFVVFMLGELLLTGFGIEYSRIISVLAVLLVLLLILVFFIELVAGVWAFLIVPVLCSLMFMASSFTVITVSQEKNDQRLPWEPTDESQVNRE